MDLIWWIVIIVAVIVLWVIFAYNNFIKLVNRAKEAWSDIDVQLKRRYDLIPQLINTVQGYVKHEREVLESVTEARTRAMNNEVKGGTGEIAQSENMLSGALKSLFAVAENYPDLKANENFIELQKELSDTENKIQASRRFYNGNVKNLNIAIESFPYNLIAGMFNFEKREFFELEEEGAREPVEVKF